MMPLIFADYYCHDDAFLYFSPADAAFSFSFSFAIFRFSLLFRLLIFAAYGHDDALLIDSLRYAADISLPRRHAAARAFATLPLSLLFIDFRRYAVSLMLAFMSALFAAIF